MTPEASGLPEQRPLTGDIELAAIQQAAGRITNQESLEGFIAGLSAREAIETSLRQGSAAVTEDQKQIAMERSAQVVAGINANRDLAASNDQMGQVIAEPVAALRKLGELDPKGVQSRRLQIEDDWSDDSVAGFMLGLYGGGPLLNSTGRAIKVDGHAPTEKHVVNLDQAAKYLRSAHAFPGVRGKYLQLFIGDFGLRKQLLRRDLTLEEMQGVPSADQAASEPSELVNPEPVSEPGLSETHKEISKAEVANLAGGVALKPPADELPEPQLETPDLETVFQDGASLEATLHNPALEPDMKKGLINLVHSWAELEHALEVNAVWGELIGPRLGELATVLQSEAETSRSGQEAISELDIALRMLMSAYDSGDIAANVGEVARRFQFSELFQKVSDISSPISDGEELNTTNRVLDLSKLESDERIQRVRRGMAAHLPDEASLERLVQRLQPSIGEGADVTGVRKMIAGQLEETESDGLSWREQEEGIRDTVTFAYLTADKSMVADKLLRLHQACELFSTEMRTPGRMLDQSRALEAGDIITRYIHPLNEELQMIQRLAARAMLFSEAR